MKTITVNVSEPVYAAFQDHARREDRKASELIREAMERARAAWGAKAAEKAQLDRKAKKIRKKERERAEREKRGNSKEAKVEQQRGEEEAAA